MPVDLESRLHTYREALDDAIEADRRDGRDLNQRDRSRGALLASATAVVALVAGLAVAAQRGSESTSTSLDTTPATEPGATATPVDGESPTNGLLPRFVIDTADFFPVTLWDAHDESPGTDADPSVADVTFTELVYIAVNDDGSLRYLEIGVTTAGNQFQFSRWPGGSDYVEISWQESNGTSITIRLSDASRSDIVWLENSATQVDDGAWADLIDRITAAELPDEIQEWRDWQSLEIQHDPVRLTTEIVG